MLNSVNLGDLIDTCAVPFITFVIGQLLPQLKLGGIVDAFRTKKPD